MQRLCLPLCLPLCLLMATSHAAAAQTLARPGWAGSGLNADPWWKRAVFYEVDGSGFGEGQASASQEGPKALAARLGALRSLDVDALLLPAPALPAPGTNGTLPDLDDLDSLIRQASERDMRVLLTLRVPSDAAELNAVARFWLNRGIAGFYLEAPPGTGPQDEQAMVQALRKATDGAVGQRIVIAEFNPDASAAPSVAGSHPASRRAVGRRSGRAGETAAAQIEIDPRLSRLAMPDAADLRVLLIQSLGEPNVLLEYQPPAPPANAPDPYPALARAMATMLLTTHPSALIDSSAGLVLEPAPDRSEAVGQSAPAVPPPPPPRSAPPGTYLPFVPYVPPPKPLATATAKPAAPDPLTLWYRQLAALHHDNAVVRSGSKTFLDFDAQNALVWVSRPAADGERDFPVVTVCNLTSSPLVLSLASDAKALGLRGTYLLTLLRSDAGMGAQDMDSVTVPPFGVYIGELHR